MAADSSPIHRPLNGAGEYEAALDEIIDSAGSALRIFDHTLSAAYNSPRRHEALRRFLLASRRNTLRIVVHEPAHLDRNCPRLLALLRQFSHAIHIHETHPVAKSVYDPFAVADDRFFVHRFHFEELRGLSALEDPIGAHTLIERFEEIWEASSPAVGPTTLGL
jgi:hypothetical protein